MEEIWMHNKACEMANTNRYPHSSTITNLTFYWEGSLIMDGKSREVILPKKRDTLQKVNARI